MYEGLLSGFCAFQDLAQPEYVSIEAEKGKRQFKFSLRCPQLKALRNYIFTKKLLVLLSYSTCVQ